MVRHFGSSLTEIYIVLTQCNLDTNAYHSFQIKFMENVENHAAQDFLALLADKRSSH